MSKIIYFNDSYVGEYHENQKIIDLKEWCSKRVNVQVEEIHVKYQFNKDVNLYNSLLIEKIKEDQLFLYSK